MKLYDAACPVCGTINKNMFLEETDGWMECEHCHTESKVMKFAECKKIPVYTMEQASKIFGKQIPAAVNQ